MPNGQNKAPIVLGAQKAGRQFRCEIARELGIPIPNDEYKTNKVMKNPAIQGLSKRMVELAEQQMQAKK